MLPQSFIDAVVGRVTKKGFSAGLKMAGAGLILNIPIAAYETSKAPRGQLAPSFGGAATGSLIGTLAAGVTTSAICLIPGLPLTAAAILGAMASAGPQSYFTKKASRAIRMFTNFDKSIRHLEMGGNYKDTELAQRQRFIALQDMHAALIPGRRYLGQEALLMHR